MDKILIVGAGGFARELLEIVLQINPKAAATFYDDVSTDAPGRLFGRFEILRSEAEAIAYFKNKDRKFAVGVGSPPHRKQLFDKFSSLGGTPSSVISPFARIGVVDNKIDIGACVLTDVVLESENTVGTGTLVHVGALISHNVTIGSYCEISPRACLLGKVRVGDLCSIGTGSIILPGLTIGNNAKIGAGAVVTRDIADGVTAVGVPARPISK